MLKNVATGCHFTGPLALRLRLSADLLRFYSLLTLYPFPVKKSMKILLLGMIYYLEIILPFQSLFYSMKNIYYKTFHFLLTFYTFEFLYNTFSLL